MRFTRRPRRAQVAAVLHEIALTQPDGFDAQRFVGAFHQILAVDSLTATPAVMVLDSMGVQSAEQLLAVMRGVAGVAAINALSYTLALYGTTGDDVVSTTVLVADDTVTFPPSLTP